MEESKVEWKINKKIFAEINARQIKVNVEKKDVNRNLKQEQFYFMDGNKKVQTAIGGEEKVMGEAE